jgi:hypothetical protein
MTMQTLKLVAVSAGLSVPVMLTPLRRVTVCSSVKTERSCSTAYSPPEPWP